MRYSSSSASRSPCCPRATRSRMCSDESSTGRSVDALIPVSYPATPVGLTRLRSARRKTDTSGAHDSLVIGDLRDDDVQRTVLRFEDDDRRAAGSAAQRSLQCIGGLGLDEGGYDLAAGETELDANALVRQRKPPPRE